MCQIIPKKRTYVPFCALVRVPSRWKVINNPYSTGVYNLYLPAIKHGTWRFSSQWKSWVSISRESSSATSDTGGVMGKFYIPLSIHHDRFTMISPWFHHDFTFENTIASHLPALGPWVFLGPEVFLTQGRCRLHASTEQFADIFPTLTKRLNEGMTLASWHRCWMWMRMGMDADSPYGDGGCPKS
jgi:hypothetical protein